MGGSGGKQGSDNQIVQVTINGVTVKVNPQAPVNTYVTGG
jgi:hypothetical protein